MATSQNQIDGRVPRTDDLDRRDSDEIKRRIDRTRGAMDETLDELGDRLNPRNLLDDVIEIFRSPTAQDTAKRASGAAGDFATNLGRQIRDNPIGATLVGAGLAWLALGSRHDDEEDDYDRIPRRRSLQNRYFAEDDDEDEFGYYTEEDLLLDTSAEADHRHGRLVIPESYGEHDDSDGIASTAKQKASSAARSVTDASSSAWESTKGAASSTAETVSNAASSAGATLSDAASSVVDGVKSAASSVGSAASSAGSATSEASRRAYLRSRAAARDAARGTRRGSRRAGRYASSASDRAGEQASAAYDATARRIRRAHDESPLALGLGVLALGALAGALIPRTRREDELMGEASDELVEQAKQASQEVYEEGREAVQRTVDTAKQSAQSQDLTGDSLAKRATRVVEKAAESISDAAKEEGLHPQQLKDDAKTIAEDVKQQAESEANDAAKSAKAEAGKLDTDAEKALKK
ncbi:DUF3618 domain-containing protein [Novipirellula rosea]|uniref:DUF3618 domain-containing protein n=1 Tax=Novipirellula rosea TaxID=1031540 RepID=A0ABP8MSN9_9BACT